MIINHWIIALYIGLAGLLGLFLYAAVIAVQILRGWDIDSMEEKQLLLERRSYLASTIIQYGFGVQMLSLLLFYMALDAVAGLLPGAMCATGALKANAYGFPALFIKMAVGFVCFGWIIVHHLDTKLEDYSLTRLKFTSLLILLPLLTADWIFQSLFFINLDPTIITSCCGVVFEIEGEGFGSSLASMPPGPMMAVFFVSGALFLSWGYMEARRPSRLGNYLFSFSSLIFFLLSIMAIISFISPYIYQIPSHHCPFDILKREYHYIGYPLYIFLFAATLLGTVCGFTEPLKRMGESVLKAVEELQRKTIRISLIFWALFVITSGLPIVYFHIRAKGGDLFY